MRLARPRLRVAARCLAGPLALAAFFLPWAEGKGALGGHTFSGYDLVRFTANLQGLALSWVEGGALWAVRIAIVLVPVAATWLTLLAPRATRHPLCRASLLYLVAFSVVAIAMGLARSGVTAPPAGLALLAVAAALASVSGLLRSAGAPSPPG